MPISTDDRATEPLTSQLEGQGEPQQPTSGRTLADEEVARVAAKRASGNVLDPIALNDPVGQSVEKVILRVGVTVIVVLVVGILLAQVACKGIQNWGIPDFTKGVSNATVERALSHGVSWGGDVVRFPEADMATFDASDGSVTVVVTNGTARNFEQLVSTSQSQAMALALSLFQSEEVQKVTYLVEGPADPETGAYSTAAGNEPAGQLTIEWARDPESIETFTCTITGYEPVENSVKTAVESESGKA